MLIARDTDVLATGDHPVLPPWKATDIGDVGAPGSSSQNFDGDYAVAGAGADIWGQADAFQFVYQSLPGDGEIEVWVSSEEDTNEFAKAGVMIRQTLDPGSPHVILDVKPDGGIEFMTRRTPGSETTFIAGAAVEPQPGCCALVHFGVYLKVTRVGDLVTGSISSDAGRTWTVVGTTTWATEPAFLGLAVTSHDTSTLNHAFFPGGPHVSTVPPPWYSHDVGQVGQAGSASYQNGVFTVSGAGSDIWGTSDSFHFVSQYLTGDSEIVARVTSEHDTNTFAKAGVMMQGLPNADDPGNATVILDVLPGGGIEFMMRPSGGSMAFIAGASSSFPVWLRLVRSGNDFTGYISSEGTTWEIVGTTTVSMSPGGFAHSIGLAVTSHDPDVLNTATFDHVAASPPGASDVVLWASDFVKQDAIFHNNIRGSWQRASDATSPDQTKLATRDTGWATLDAPLAGPTDYLRADFHTMVDGRYHIWLRLHATNNSKWNDSVWVQLGNATQPGSSAPAFPIGSTDGLLVNLENCSGCGLSGWGFQDHAWWLGQSPIVDLPAGVHTIQIQVREDGVELDEVVLSPSRFLTTPPGPVKDATTYR